MCIRDSTSAPPPLASAPLCGRACAGSVSSNMLGALSDEAPRLAIERPRAPRTAYAPCAPARPTREASLAAGATPPSCRARFFIDEDARELDDAARTARQAHCEEARAYEGAREFLELALNVDPRARFEADAALAHPWLARTPPC